VVAVEMQEIERQLQVVMVMVMVMVMVIIIMMKILMTMMQATKQHLATAESQLRQLSAESASGKLKMQISEVLRDQAIAQSSAAARAIPFFLFVLSSVGFSLKIINNHPPPPPPFFFFLLLSLLLLFLLQRTQLSKTSKLLQQQRQQLKHYRDIYRLKQSDLEFKKNARTSLKSSTSTSTFTIRSGVGGDEVLRSRMVLEEAARKLHNIVR
jgi:ABC-type maltose transport system permease subunit